VIATVFVLRHSYHKSLVADGRDADEFRAASPTCCICRFARERWLR
jgi:hypothetical protein